MKMFKKSKRGFSLVELLVVIAVMAVIAGAGMFVVGDKTEGAPYAVAKTNIDNLAKAIVVARASGKTVTVVDGAVNLPASWSAGRADVEAYLSMALDDYPDNIVFDGNTIALMDGASVATYDLNGDGTAEDIKAKF